LPPLIKDILKLYNYEDKDINIDEFKYAVSNFAQNETNFLENFIGGMHMNDQALEFNDTFVTGKLKTLNQHCFELETLTLLKLFENNPSTFLGQMVLFD
jgi:hypothetical protein